MCISLFIGSQACNFTDKLFKIGENPPLLILYDLALFMTSFTFRKSESVGKRLTLDEGESEKKAQKLILRIYTDFFSIFLEVFAMAIEKHFVARKNRAFYLI